MKKFVLSVSCALLSAVLLVGCAPQPTVSTDAPSTAVTTTTTVTTTTAAPTTTTTTVATITTTTTTAVTAKPTAAITTTTPLTWEEARAKVFAHSGFTQEQVVFSAEEMKKEGDLAHYFFMFSDGLKNYEYTIHSISGKVLDRKSYVPTGTTKKTTRRSGPEEYAIRFEKDASIGWEKVELTPMPKNGYKDPDAFYIVGGRADIYLNGKWVSIKKAVQKNPAVLSETFNAGLRYAAAAYKKEPTPKDYVKTVQYSGGGFSHVEYTDHTIGFWWFLSNKCPLHPYDVSDEQDRTAFGKAHADRTDTVYILCPPNTPLDIEDLPFCTAKNPPTEYAIQFEKDTSVGRKRLHKDTETTEHGDIIVTGSYIVDGNAKVYVKGKWISLKKAIKNDPNVMEKIWSKAKKDNAARSTGNAYPKNFITMRQYKGDGVNYAQYSDYTLIYCTGGGDNPSITPCPVHEYPGIGDRKWEDLSEEEKQAYLKILREYEHSHNVRWYMILPPNVPIPTWDDICEKDICYMDI